jgi:hypothetical protein
MMLGSVFSFKKRFRHLSVGWRKGYVFHINVNGIWGGEYSLISHELTDFLEEEKEEGLWQYGFLRIWHC